MSMGLVGSAERIVEAAAPSGSPASEQALAIRERAHRPWEMPRRPWLQAQTWSDLLFAHWPVAPDVLRAVLPPGLPIDTFDGAAWIGITPFEVRGMRARGTPPAPFLSRFAEVNVRTYTTIGGRPGIWFLSLDAASRLAVASARRLYRLPYHHAAMTIDRGDGGIEYRSRRLRGEASLRATYAPAGTCFTAEPGSLEHFLTERYCLYAIDDRRRVLRADIHHPPWPLQHADADFQHNTMTLPYGIALPPEPPLLHFAARQDVVIWSLARDGTA